MTVDPFSLRHTVNKFALALDHLNANDIPQTFAGVDIFDLKAWLVE